MATPITWRNVSTGRGLDDGGGLASAISAFSNAQRGGLAGAEDVRARQAVEDKRRTNKAIADEIAGLGPSRDRRVDQVLTQTARLEREAHGEDLLTSAVNRRVNQTQADLNQENLDVFDERFQQETDQVEADINQSKAATAASNLEIRLANASETERARIQTQTNQASGLDNEAIDFAQNRYLESVGVNRDTMTPAQEEAMILAGTDFIDGAAGDEWIRQRGIELGLDPDVMDSSPSAIRVADSRRLAKEAEAAAAILAIQREQQGFDFEQEKKQGLFGLAVWGPNGVEALKPENAKAEKMTSFKDTVNLMENNGISASKWQNPNKKRKDVAALESARNRISNRSLFEQTVLPWMDPDGTLDRKGLNKAMSLLGSTNKEQQLEGQKRINDKRRERNPDAQQMNLVELIEAAKAAGGGDGGSGGEPLTIAAVTARIKEAAPEVPSDIAIHSTKGAVEVLDGIDSAVNALKSAESLSANDTQRILGISKEDNVARLKKALKDSVRDAAIPAPQDEGADALTRLDFSKF